MILVGSVFILDTKIIDEREFIEKFKEKNLQGFHKFVSDYDNYIAPTMRARGYKFVNYAERTVTFTFGQVTFSRRRWYKNGKCRIPVDEKLGLEKRIAYSKELLYQITKLATMLPYRKVVEVIELMYQVCITKDTVLKAIKLASQLLNEKEDYRFYRDEVVAQKIEAPVIYLEGDGVWIKVSGREKEQQNKELSHFVIHTGTEVYGKRKILKNKVEIVSPNNRTARKRVVDYIYNHFKITSDTLLVTNSDMGHGYTPYLFKEISHDLGIKHHQHFWDRYHLNKEIKKLVKPYSVELLDQFMKAIDSHCKKKLKTTIDTLESFVLLNQNEKKIDTFKVFKNRILGNFKYTQPPEQRNLDTASLGIMESQHRKISYRMKNRGMYWSLNHVDAMSHLILLSYNQELRDLFFGNWRNEYEKYRSEGMSGAKVRKKINQAPRSLGTIVNASWKGRKQRDKQRFAGKKINK